MIGDISEEGFYCCQPVVSGGNRYAFCFFELIEKRIDPIIIEILHGDSIRTFALHLLHIFKQLYETISVGSDGIIGHSPLNAEMFVEEIIYQTSEIIHLRHPALHRYNDRLHLSH